MAATMDPSLSYIEASVDLHCKYDLLDQTSDSCA